MGYEEKYQKKINIDCLYSIDIIENTTGHDFISDLMALENNNNICEGYKINLEISILDNIFEISDLKKIMKHNGIVEFYIFISKLRKILSVPSCYSMTMDMLWDNKTMIDFFGCDYMTRMKYAFVSFIFYWNRIELTLVKRGIPLSTRCYQKFSIKDINKLLNEDWGETTSIQCILDAKNNLTNIIKEGLLKL